MTLLIILLILALFGVIFCSIMLHKEPENNSWVAPIVVGAFIIGVTFSLIAYEITPHNQFKTDILPRVDTVITYTSVNQQFDTTYIYTFKNE